MYQQTPESLRLAVPETVALQRDAEVQASIALMAVLGGAEAPQAPIDYGFMPTKEQQPVVDELDARRTANENAVTTAEVNQTRYGVSNAQKAA